jgi:hypothetical protein
MIDTVETPRNNYIDTVETPRNIDLWTLVHGIGGACAFFIIVALTGASPAAGFVLWMIIHLVYEANDVWYAYYSPSASSNSQNSFSNSVVDQLAAALGFGLAVALWGGRRPSVAQAVAAAVVWGAAQKMEPVVQRLGPVVTGGSRE